jgi:C-terminal processing protease CtpA/Prc
MAGVNRLAGVVLVLASAVLLSAPTAEAQAREGQQEDRRIDADLRAEIIDSVTATLARVYVFPDVAERMEAHVHQQSRNGRYDQITSLREFADTLTGNLYEICKDKHLHVHFVPDEIFARYEADTLTEAGWQEKLAQMKRDNFGFYKIERLSGNIGYLDFRYFADARWAGETAVAAVKFLANSDALIIDLRNNGGGSPSMIQLISSYFFEEPVHLNSFYIRTDDTIKQFWSQSYVDGQRMTDVDIYVLTSGRTFSGAEEFTYNLKNLKRATIIGETTGGGAHPVEQHGFEQLNVAMSVPFGRAINPVTGTNWEGTGVEPDIKVPQEQALTVARIKAMDKLIENTEEEGRREELRWDLETLKAIH